MRPIRPGVTQTIMVSHTTVGELVELIPEMYEFLNQLPVPASCVDFTSADSSSVCAVFLGGADDLPEGLTKEDILEILEAIDELQDRADVTEPYSLDDLDLSKIWEQTENLNFLKLAEVNRDGGIKSDVHFWLEEYPSVDFIYKPYNTRSDLSNEKDS
jgi:hypothetical protein